MKEITVVHKETLTQENGRTVVYNEWLYDGYPIHIAMWFDDHLVKAKNIELNIYDEIPKPPEGSLFTGPVGRFVIHSENGYWIDNVMRHEPQHNTGLYQNTPEGVSVNSFTLKLDNSGIRNLGITLPVHHEDGRLLWKEDKPLLEYLQEKQDGLTNQTNGPTGS